MQSVLRSLALLIVALGLLNISTARTESRAAFSGSPHIILWAWEMPERLSFIDPQKVAVAYLDQTIYVGQSVRIRPRLQPMQAPAGTQMIAVVRIEMAASAASSPETTAKIVAALLGSARQPGVIALQVDFDAVKSQQPFYAEILKQVRREMPPGMPLSVTALASWCAYDRWLSDLPIDEAVPMLFRMGKEQDLFRAGAEGPLLREPLCSGSLGVSTDEAWPKSLRGKRIYVFNPRPWTEKSLARVLEQVEQ
jgi:hypothetical protein